MSDGMIIHIPEPEVTPFAEHHIWGGAGQAYSDDYRRRVINVLADPIEQLIEAANNKRMDDAKPARWNV